MKRLITKKMRDSFKVSFDCRVARWNNQDGNSRWKDVYTHFDSTKKQRILILKGVIK